MNRRNAFAVSAIAVGVLLLSPGGFAQQQSVQRPSVNATGLKGAPASSTEAQTTLTFFYGKRQTFRSMGIPQRWANVLGGRIQSPERR